MNNVKQEIATRELARRHFRHYLPYVYGKYWVYTRMSAFLADEIESFIRTDTGHAYDILVIQTPPQHGKSMTVTESLPSWYLGMFPEKQVIIASYDSDYAEKFCRSNKEKIRSVGSTLFGISIGKVDRAQEFLLSNSKGRLISRGIMSGITGNSANLIIIDDPVKNQQEADSPTYRDRVWEEWQSSIKSRLSAGGKVVVIMTPWHEDDFAARILAAEPNSRLLRLPVEAEENDPLGRSVGEPLCPEIGKDAVWLHDFKESYIHDSRGGQRAWTALYQCSPRREDGNIVKREWWKFYAPGEVPENALQFISVDASFKDGENNDYVAIEVWARAGQDYYLLYCLNKHLDFPGTVAALKNISCLYPKSKRVLIEDKANGSAVIQVLQKEMYCIPVDPNGGKIARLNAVSAAIESGHVFLPDPGTSPWVTDFIDQFTAFPNGRHDDMVDAATQAMQYMIYAPGSSPIFERKEMKGLWKFLSKQQLF